MLLALALTAAPPAPAAGAGTEVQRPRSGVGLILDGGRGRFVVLSFPTAKLALLSVLQLAGGKEGAGVATASYAVRAHSRPGRGVLRADFGPIGSVAVRFRPAGKGVRGKLPRGCRGPRPGLEFGRARGRISLRGEGGYFRVDSRSAVGIRERSFRLVCRKGRALNVPPNVSLRELVAPTFFVIASSDGGSIALLNAVAKVDGRFVALRAAHDEGQPPGAQLQVGTLESGNGLAIGRSLVLQGGRGTLRTSLPGAQPATATLAPPSPFRGEGGFLGTSARSHSWTGSLRVRLPGLDLPLTGPRFVTSLCVLSPLKSPRGCDFAKPKALLRDPLALIPGVAEL